jgi:hypothetical protein
LGVIDDLFWRSDMPNLWSRTAAVLALCAGTGAAASCAGRFVEPGPTGGAIVKSARLGWYTKKVVAKRAPETLLAEDGTICRVAPDRFGSTAAGAAVYCNWQ